MLKSLAVIISLIISGIAVAQNSPEFVAEVNGLAHCESVAFSPSTQLLYVSSMADKENGDGYISTVSLKGEIIDKHFITGLDDPKGIAISGEKLFVSDISVLIEADLSTGKIIKRHQGEGEVFLNDVAVSENREVFVSDMSGSSIYKLNKDGEFSEWFSSSKLQTPNGLLVDEGQLYVAGWASDESKNTEKTAGGFLQLEPSKKDLKALTRDLGNLDGIQKYDNNSFLVSAWDSGIIYKIHKDGNCEEILQSEKSVGDLLYIRDKNLLILPLNFQNKLMIYKY
ncbi:hypothetical protein [Christiangramia aquimixticola]|uniref:hypothetical protein n=1 Tax=Christiangramia aquimixticola TaxID=1697558 RepID=UPI003AA82C80